MRWFEPTWLAVRSYDVPFFPPSADRPARPVRLLHLSDFHASEEVPLDFVRRAVTQALTLQPDLICLTGDFITWRHEEFSRYAEILKPMADVAPVYAVLGNHDGGRWVGTAGYPDTDKVRSLLSAARIELLHNRSSTLQAAGQTIRLVGVGDLWADELDGERAFGDGVRDDSVPGVSRAPVVLLAHNPDSKDVLRRHSWDLMLSGHTHGGQCDLVFFGTPFAPVRDHRFVRGLRAWEKRSIHVTAGIGNLHGLRFNCRPEISLLRLV